MTVRPAEPADVPTILRLVRELAAYEREPDAVEATEQHLHTALFPSEGEPTTFCHVAESDGKSDGEPEREVVGMAVWFVTFSTWTGRHGIWLEDLYVRPEHRGSGLGRELLRELAATCVRRGYRRLEWWVLDWNRTAIGFYESLGARPQDDWTTHRLDGEALARLGR